MFLNFIGMVLFAVFIVVAVTGLVRGARCGNAYSFAGPWGPYRRGRKGRGKHGGYRGGHKGHGHRREHPQRWESRADHRDHGAGRGEGAHGEAGAITAAHAGEGRRRRRDDALSLARVRLARSEISVDEYNSIRAALEA